MTNFVNMFFGPLDKSSCVYFLIICGLFFVALVIVLGSELLYVIRNLRNLSFKAVSNGILILFNVFLAYFVNRLLYTMCTKSLA